MSASNTQYSPSDLISDARFHRRVTLPTPHGPQTLTYACVGSNDPTASTLLFLPGMFASRYLGIPQHVLAERAGVRLLIVDRFGMGGSADVPLARRISTWCEIVPRLLAQLRIEYVGLVVHSAGTIYALNMLMREECKRVVRGGVVFLAPWVSPTHSHVTSMQLAQYIPAPAFKLWHHIPRFFITQATPVLASSGAAVRKISAPSGTIFNGRSQSQEEEDRTFLEANYRRVEREYGIPVTDQAELARLAVNYMFAENTVGANSEALQCLRKGDGGDWGVAGDYGVCVRGFVEREREGERNERPEQGKFRVRVYYGATDALVGRKGQEYFESCWRDAGEGVDFGSKWVEGTDHDTVSQAAEVWEGIFGFLR
ncbi:Alpha/Beta hydrolase protein [Aspergillus pseudoustus]|uniref:Alpha/Beta hydrolase protein n=1 Tax=Aspergillus pseudoustus TaxID=1810923 RepID=A0ABR4JHG0_9EURO